MTETVELVDYEVTAISSAVAGTNVVPVAIPSGAAVGQYLVVFAREQANLVTNIMPSIPGGLLLYLGEANNSVHRANFAVGRPVTSDNIGDTSVDVTFALAGSGRGTFIAVLFSGVDVADPLVNDSTGYSSQASAGYCSMIEWEGATEGQTVVFYGSEFSAGNDHAPITTPPGYTKVAEGMMGASVSVSRTYEVVFLKDNEATAPEPSAVIQWGTPSGTNGAAFILRRAAGLFGTSVLLGDGSQARLSFLDGIGERVEPARVSLIKPGFDSVAEMLSVPGATWAHRGGSASYPEMSEFAYDRSVLRGFGALEFSCQRSSDGVFFGLHDSNFDSISGVSGSPNASTMTWADIQEMYKNTRLPSATHPSRPLWRLEEFVEKWGETHVLILDPKNALPFNTAMLDVVGPYVDPDRLVWKYSGMTGPTGISARDAAAARGWATWGYYYAEDASTGLGGNGGLQSSGSGWDFLGMSYNASQAIWDEVLAFGKPTVAHIAPTQDAYNEGTAKGADMVQCSGVAVITPIR